MPAASFTVVLAKLKPSSGQWAALSRARYTERKMDVVGPLSRQNSKPFSAPATTLLAEPCYIFTDS